MFSVSSEICFYCLLSRKSEGEDQDSEEPDKAVNELKSIESVKSIEETKEATTLFHCEKCKQQYSKSTIGAHLKKCYNLSKKRGMYNNSGRFVRV